MRNDSFWTADAPPYAPPQRPLPAAVDVAVVGAGFTGLSAALALARRGARVLLLEQGPQAGAEASTRNGGHVNSGLAIDYAETAAAYGPALAAAWYRAYDDAVDTVQQLVRDEGIACDFIRTGKLKLAAREAGLDGLRRTVERLHADGVDTDTEILERDAVRAEVASEQFVGGMLYRRSGQMHMGRFAHGLAAAVERAGAQIEVGTPVQRLERLGATHRHRVHTPRGVVQADQVLLATGATRHGGYGSFGWIRRRIVPVGSFLIATEPLGEARARALLAGRRTYVTVAHIHHYFRLSPDHRLLFGGRARFAVSNPTQDRSSGEILRQGMEAMFPALRGVRIDHCWGGLVDMTRDRLPRAGERDGLYYATGLSGHGTQMSVHLGRAMARVMAGEAAANPFAGRPWPAIPGHLGPPWFLPLVGLYYQLKDKLA
jgi:glycine/D-amino acid oxidase-like deaminating enzyme